MAKDTPADAPKTSEPSRLDTLRAKFAALQKRVPDLKFERVEPNPDPEKGNKGYTLVRWGRTRVAQVCEGGITPDDAECAVLEVAIAHLSVS